MKLLNYILHLETGCQLSTLVNEPENSIQSLVSLKSLYNSIVWGHIYVYIYTYGDKRTIEVNLLQSLEGHVF